MRILVTGGAGFIGSHIADAFVAKGHEVLVVDNLAIGSRANVPAGVRFVEMDITSPALFDVVQDFRPDVVDHHAAHADVRQSLEDPVADAETNVLGIISLINAGARAGMKRFVFASSGGAMYGEPEVIPCTESHPVRPICPYGAAKAASEVYIETFSRIHGFECTILRYPNVYGPRQHPYTEEGQVVAIFSQLMLAGRQPTIFGDGEQARDFAYVGDIVAANVLAVENNISGTFNIGTGELLTINELTRSIARLTGYTGEIKYAPARPGEVYRICLDATRAHSVLGWEAKMPLEAGLRATVESVRAAQSGSAV